MIYEGEGEATSMFENNSTSFGYTHTCIEIRIIQTVNNSEII